MNDDDNIRNALKELNIKSEWSSWDILDALRRASPKGLDEFPDIERQQFFCPSCNLRITKIMGYCYRCGQALKYTEWQKRVCKDFYEDIAR